MVKLSNAFVYILCIFPVYILTLTIQVGRQIPVAGSYAKKLNEEISNQRLKLKLLEEKENNDDMFSFGNSWRSKGLQKQRTELRNSLSGKIKEYLMLNTCLRYYLNDVFDFSALDFSKNAYTGIWIAITVNIDNEPDHNTQSFNLNVMDRMMNVLRRKDDISQNLHVAIDYPVRSRNRDEYDKEYVDICFENQKIDLSWNSNPPTIDTYTIINFGFADIKQESEKLASIVDDTSKSFQEAEVELLNLIKQTDMGMGSAYADLRNATEDTYTKQWMFLTATIILYCMLGVFELLWIRSLLRHCNAL